MASFFQKAQPDRPAGAGAAQDRRAGGGSRRCSRPCRGRVRGRTAPGPPAGLREPEPRLRPARAHRPPPGLRLERQWCALRGGGLIAGLRDRTARSRCSAHFQLARSLGAEVVSRKVEKMARRWSSTPAAAGTAGSWWARARAAGWAACLRRRRGRPDLQRRGDIDVYVVRGTPEAKAPEPVPRQKVRWAEYGWSADPGAERLLPTASTYWVSPSPTSSWCCC